ncbi:hypothetical protein [Neomoorella thermoacetica]|uniref:N-acetyltransferase domain-containing protein n=1 Tax=Neomoorella thermoacetica TaxID=1525 RepID=A0A1J5P1E7_NEOTH|nr:hypothetical protein [Moorella thermoacetica]APC09371.1 hypothetical protein MTJW_22220 [Moorella thermoacetica]OIQ09100.1 hypothetical protein MOOR_12110 [Moorella thermoacetica]OIQ54839.1 hypothetical protein MORE_12170 [Moorella thermoacetica]OIQ59387.1 hypothetical protein MTIN_23280 [Moorella thermoacetica]
MIIDKLEQSLRPPETPMVPYPPKYITLASGEKMVVHQISREDVPRVLEAVKPMVTVEKDFYDIVAARLYAELLGYYRYRVKDEYCLVGTIDGVIAGIVNGRMLNEKVGMSYHTMTLKRGLRIGAQLFAAKMEYHLDYLGQEEVWIVAESPIGFRRWMIEYELEPRPEQWHELGGVPTYVLTKALWEKHKAAKCTGRRPVPEEMLATARKLIVPSV